MAADVDEEVLVLEVAVAVPGVARHVHLREAPVQRALDLEAVLDGVFVGDGSGWAYVELHHEMVDAISIRQDG